MANGIYKITEDFEKALGDYTGAKYVVTVVILALNHMNMKVYLE